MSFVSIKLIMFFIIVYVVLVLFILKLFHKDLRSKIVGIVLLITNYVFVAITDYRFAICVAVFTLFLCFAELIIRQTLKN